MSNNLFSRIANAAEPVQEDIARITIHAEGSLYRKLRHEYDILALITYIAGHHDQYWAEIKRAVEPRLVSDDEDRGFIHELDGFIRPENRIVKLTKEHSAIVYADKELHDYLKKKHKPEYLKLKDFGLHIIGILKLNGYDMKKMYSELRSRHFYDLGAMLDSYFPDIR